VPYSKNKEAVVKVLVNKEVIGGYKKDFQGLKKNLIINLRTERIRPLQIKRVSKPGCRIYLGNKKFYNYKGGQGFLIVSTSKGIMDSGKAKKLKVGGEILAEVF
jgi:small subunit ribosomal protein S8